MLSIQNNARKAARPAVRLSVTIGALLALAGQAIGAPAALDRVPTDAIVVVATPSLERLDKNAGNLITAAEMPQMSTPSQLLGMLGLKEGLDMTGSAAIALMPGDMAAEVPPVVMLLPTKDYAGLLKSFGATAGEGVTEFVAAGETLFAKDAGGGYAAVGMMKEMVEKFDAAPGKGEAHAARLGVTGRAVLEDADVVVVADVPAFMATFGEGVNPFGGAFQQMFSGPGLIQNPAGRVSPLMDAIKRDATFGVVGLTTSSLAATIDAAVQFKEGSELFEATAAGGSSAGLLNSLPADPFIMAYGIDVNAGGMRNLVRKVMAPQAGEAEQPATQNILLGLIDVVNAQAGVIYPNPGGLFAGVIARGVFYYEAPDAQGFKDALQRFLESVNGVDDGNVMLTTSFTPGAATINGVSADAYGIKVGFSGGRAGTPMMMFYGQPGGPTGHIAAGGRGVYMTTSPDQALMTKALGAAQPGAKSVGADPLVEQIGGMLPANRTFEMYLGVKPVMDQVAPILAMAGRPLAAPIPADMPPVGVGAVVGGGGLRVTTIAPAPVIKTINTLRDVMGAPPAGQGAPAQEQGGKPGF